MGPNSAASSPAELRRIRSISNQRSCACTQPSARAASTALPASMVTTPSASRSTCTGAVSPARACSPSSAGRLARSSSQAATSASSASAAATTRMRGNHLRIAHHPLDSRRRTLHRQPATGHARLQYSRRRPNVAPGAHRMIDSPIARVPGINAWPDVASVDALPSVTLAILLLFVGKGLTARVAVLRRYSIPEPVVGGVLCAAVVCALYYGMGLQVDFELGARDMFLLYFFAALGLNSNVASLRKGGWKLVVLLALAGFYIVFQNLVGMGLARAWGMDPRAGLMVGSISLTGGVGTTVAWTPHFVEELGIANAGELGLASNMVGMIAA